MNNNGWMGRYIILALAFSIAAPACAQLPPQALDAPAVEVPPVVASAPSAAAVPAPLPTPAPAAIPLEARTPLVIVRFNEPHLDFTKALANAVASATAAKPDVAYDVVLHAGTQGDAGESANAQKVLSNLRTLGVPDSRVTSNVGAPSGKRYDEVMVYVK